MSLRRNPSTFASYAALTKPRITLFVVLTAFVGFAAGTAGPLTSIALPLLLHTLLGTALVASGTSAFNDVTSGSNGAYSAGIGYDLVTGIVVPNVTALMAAIMASSPAANS